LKLSKKEIYYTVCSLLVMLKNSCSKLQCQKGSSLPETNPRVSLRCCSLFRSSSRLESLILSNLTRFTCECSEEEIDDDDDNDIAYRRVGCIIF